jgi:hypothetical protein
MLLVNRYSARRNALLAVLYFGLLILRVEPVSAQAVPTHIRVSAGHNYDLTGNFKFETEFSEMAGFNSPTVNRNSLDGSFVFKPKSNQSPGGRIQVTFRDVKASFSARCVVGATGQEFNVTLSDSSGGAKHITVSSGLNGGESVITFSGDPMYGQGDYLIIITSPSAGQDWMLYRCDVIGTPLAIAAAPLAPKAPKSRN